MSRLLKDINRYLIIFVIFMRAGFAFAQEDIVSLEYYVDNDPGVGNGTTLPVAQGSVVDIANEIINTSSLPAGHHTIGFRAMNAAGTWGFTEKREFYIPPASAVDPPVAMIDAMEYYIDNDPGTGSSTSIPLSQSLEIDLPDIIIETSGLSAGFHTIGFRARNTDGTWGMVEKREFYIPQSNWVDPPVADISELEYYFDEDPGHGQATPLPGSGNVVDINTIIPESLSAGHHTLHIRAKNTDGIWGITESRKVYVKPSGTIEVVYDIVKMEYFLDGQDPGFGNASDIPIIQGPEIDLDPVNLATPSNLIDGQHTVTVRAQNENGVWGLGETSSFDVFDDCVQPTADFSLSLACAGEPVEFVDNSLNIDPATVTYRWYVDGELVANTIGNVLHTFTVPGDHQVSLAIRQGTICFDSTSVNLNIKPKPIVIFNAQTAELGDPTNFEVDAFNVDPSAIWEWDFENDGTVDANTRGNVSFTYPDVGTYLASLLVSDQAGCETLYQKSVAVEPVGAGDQPVVVFTSDIVAAGNPTSFSVVYQVNVDPVWTWSWDFDTDGTPDDNTRGNTAFTYSQEGTYVATLTIDDGAGNTYEFTAPVTVEAAGSGTTPYVVFSADEVDEGDPTTITIVYQSDIHPAWAWSWDFDSDGAEDDNTVGNTQFTYPSAGIYPITLSIDDGAGNNYVFTGEAKVNTPVTGPPPVISFTASTAVLGEQTKFTVEYQDHVEPEWDWYWDFDSDGTTDDETKGGTTYTYNQAGEYVATLTIVDLLNNEFTFSELVKVLPPAVELKVYNLVTFNGDGIYDYFEIENIESTPANTVRIYDRAGTLVFEMNEYNNLQRVFRGLSNINGTRELPQGNYFYTIDKGDGSKPITGFLYLKR